MSEEKRRRIPMLIVGLCFALLAWGNSRYVMAEISGTLKDEILQSVRSDLAKRTISSGTLDLFEPTLEKVRNLRLLELESPSESPGGQYLVKGKYRDIGNGDLITVHIPVKKSSAGWEVEEITIAEVTKLDKGVAAGQDNKEFSDTEIQKVMRSYIDQQAKFTGTLMLFDEERDKMRTLELIEMAQEVRRLGILYISRAEFKDVEAGDILGIDITVENNKGDLQVQSLRVRDVKKSQ